MWDTFNAPKVSLIQRFTVWGLGTHKGAGRTEVSKERWDGKRWRGRR